VPEEYRPLVDFTCETFQETRACAVKLAQFVAQLRGAETNRACGHCGHAETDKPVKTLRLRVPRNLMPPLRAAD